MSRETPEHNFLARLSAPARCALENNGIDTVEKLSNFTEKEILKFHGVGKSTIPRLVGALKEKGLSFREDH